MATSSITKNFVVSGRKQVEMFANAIEESYQESLHRMPGSDLRITHLRGSEEVKNSWQRGRMQMINDISVFYIREYLSNKDDEILGEEALQQLLSEFSCKRNSDVERFLKEQSIEFTKKKQSVTYLVFPNEDAVLVGNLLQKKQKVNLRIHICWYNC